MCCPDLPVFPIARMNEQVSRINIIGYTGIADFSIPKIRFIYLLSQRFVVMFQFCIILLKFVDVCAVPPANFIQI